MFQHQDLLISLSEIPNLSVKEYQAANILYGIIKHQVDSTHCRLLKKLDWTSSISDGTSSQIRDTGNVSTKIHVVVKSPAGLPNDRLSVVDARSDTD